MNYYKQNNSNFKEKCIISLIVFVIISLFGVLATVGVNPNNGDGSRIGQFIALTQKGLFNKTWEAEIIKGGMAGGSGGFGIQPFWVTVPNNLVPTVQGNLLNQTEVNIKYHSAGIYLHLNTGSGGDFLLEVSPVSINKK